MAQIKKIVKPGDLIRGAKVGVAGLDKTGNVIGTGIDAEDLTTWPEGAQSGDVLTWGGETGPEWTTFNISENVASHFTPITGVSMSNVVATKIGNMVFFFATFTNNTESNISENTTIMSTDLIPTTTARFTLFYSTNIAVMNVHGNFSIANALNAGSSLSVSGFYSI